MVEATAAVTKTRADESLRYDGMPPLFGHLEIIGGDVWSKSNCLIVVVAAAAVVELTVSPGPSVVELVFVGSGGCVSVGVGSVGVGSVGVGASVGAPVHSFIATW